MLCRFRRRSAVVPRELRARHRASAQKSFGARRTPLNLVESVPQKFKEGFQKNPDVTGPQGTLQCTPLASIELPRMSKGVHFSPVKN